MYVALTPLFPWLLQVVVLPPGEWDPTIRLAPPASPRKAQERLTENAMVPMPSKEKAYRISMPHGGKSNAPDLHHAGLKRTGRWVNDVKGLESMTHRLKCMSHLLECPTSLLGQVPAHAVQRCMSRNVDCMALAKLWDSNVECAIISWIEICDLIVEWILLSCTQKIIDFLASAPLHTHTQDTEIGLGALVWQPQPYLFWFSDVLVVLSMTSKDVGHGISVTSETLSTYRVLHPSFSSTSRVSLRQ